MDQQKEEVLEAVNLANKEFIKGFVAGQVILAFLIFILLKVFLFRGATETKLEMNLKKNRVLKVFSVNIADRKVPVVKKTLDSFILKKLNHTNIQESCEWLSLLLARCLSEYRDSEEWREKLIKQVDHLLNTDVSDQLPFLMVYNLIFMHRDLFRSQTFC
jgi:maintenance of morphology protein 1